MIQYYYKNKQATYELKIEIPFPSNLEDLLTNRATVRNPSSPIEQLSSTNIFNLEKSITDSNLINN